MSILLIDLDHLHSGSYRSRGSVKPAQLDFRDETEFRFSEPIRLDLRVSTTDKLTFYISGTLRYKVSGECRRCLKEIIREQKCEVKGVYAFPEALAKLNLSQEERDSQGIYSLQQGQRKIDLSLMVRESIILDYPHFLQCSEDCKGLCPYCGADLNIEPCNCSEEAFDPRWVKLKKLFQNR